MTALLERAEQAISVTKVARSAKDLLDNLTNGKQDKYVLMRNNEPAAVMLAVDAFQNLCDDIDDLRTELTALKRLQNWDDSKAISHEQLLSEFELD